MDRRPSVAFLPAASGGVSCLVKDDPVDTARTGDRELLAVLRRADDPPRGDDIAAADIAR